MFKRQSSVFDEGTLDEVDHLLTCVKRQVKQIMEESVTKKFIHEDSSSITTLCGAVEACLKHRLRKQTINLFNSSSSTIVLLHKISKYSDDAKRICQAVTALEGQSEPFSRFSLKNLTMDSKQSPNHNTNGNGMQKYAWIRMALFSRVLANIVSYLVTNSSKYYETGSLIADQAKGSLLSQLLEGPCALEYSRMRTSDHLYTDPNADELVLRHRLHSSTSVVGQSSITSPSRRPALGLGRSRCSTSSSSEDSMRSVPAHAREYVESLHQNHKTNLLYGKNNVRVVPRDSDESIPGYLSLHETCESLSLKWTPNQLINSNSKRPSHERMQTHLEERSPTAPQCENNKSHGNGVNRNMARDSNHCTQSSRLTNRHPPLMWDCAISVEIDEIVYLHCHHQGTCGGTLILVGADGVQSPAFDFPFGGHLLAFLACLESGLQPHAQLDPPLWIHKDTGKIFPKLKKKLSKSKHSASEGSDANDSQPLFSDVDDIDYVFRIVSSCKPKGLHDLVDPRRLSFPSLPLKLPWTRPKPVTTGGLQSQISSSEKSSSLPANGDIEKPPLQARDSLQKLCDTMKTRILSRAFYGWLAHCRHLKTVREHLSGLVYNNETTLPAPAENEKHLSTEFWNRLSDTDMVFLQVEIYRRIYYGGMAHEIRKHVWPYLLGHYKFGCSKVERRKIDVAASKHYENIKEEWMSVEALLEQRKEMAKASHKTSDSEDEKEATCEPAAGVSTPDNFRSCLLERQPSALSNDVFLDTVIVADVTTEPFRNSTKPHPPLTKWHTVDSNYREDFCSVKMSHTYGGFRRHSLDDDNEAELSPLVNDAVHDEKVLEEMAINLHRIDKDVHRCDRSYWYFTDNNLKKLRNVMCTYVWRNLDVGYVQGMCDLVAPLLVIFDDESLTYSCFCHLMKRMVENFPNGKAMDNHLANMRSLIRVLDPELYDLMQQDGDYSHFFFCYRWLLLDFKREMCYDDVFLVWESIWSAKHICSDNYVAFIALGMIEAYRDILLDNSMDFIDVIKFFNEMAEKHDAKEVLSIARELVFKLQSLIELK